jgi:hypothetical protein
LLSRPCFIIASLALYRLHKLVNLSRFAYDFFRLKTFQRLVKDVETIVF